MFRVCVCVHVCAWSCTLSRVQIFKIPWTVAHQAPRSMEFSKQDNEMGYNFLFYIQFNIVIFCEFPVSVDLIKKNILA